MDLDAYVDAHAPAWQRLDDLAGQRRLTGAESDEILDLYQRVATHLSVIRSTGGDPALVQYLSTVLTRARGRSSGGTVTTLSSLIDFTVRGLPAALYRMRLWWLSVMAIFVVATAACIGWLLQNPEYERSLMSPDEVDHLVNYAFEGYYSTYPPSSFALQVWTNNFWLAVSCIVFGVFALPVIYVLIMNIVNVAVTGSVMIGHGRADLFFGLITPHGLLELTCIFVAAGVGLRLFWAWVAPGERPRGQALAEEGRAAIGIGLGLIVFLFISGIIEAFVTPSPLPTAARIAIGILAWGGFLAYVFVLGRRADRDGITGDIDERDRAATAPTA